MNIELRPLDLGEVLDRTIQIFRSRFRMFIGIGAAGAVFFLFFQVWQLIMTRVLPAHHSSLYIQIANGLVTLCLACIMLLVYSVIYPAMYRAVGDMYTGTPTGVRHSYAAVWPHWFRYFRLNISIALVCAAPIVLPLIALFGVIAASSRLRPAIGTGGMIAIFSVLGLLLILATAFSIWLGLRYILAGAACVFENIGVVQAFRRSALLTKGQRFRVVLLAVMAGVLAGAISGIFMIPVIPFMLIHRGRPVIALAIAVLVGGFISRVLAQPITGIGWMVCYFDARIRREGFDVERMLQHSAGVLANPEIAPPVSQQPGITGLNPA